MVWRAMLAGGMPEFSVRHWQAWSVWLAIFLFPVFACGGDAVANLLRRRDCFDGGGVPGVWPDRGLVFAQSHGADVSDVPADHDGGVGWGAGGGRQVRQCGIAGFLSCVTFSGRSESYSRWGLRLAVYREYDSLIRPGPLGAHKWGDGSPRAVSSPGKHSQREDSRVMVANHPVHG